MTEIASVFGMSADMNSGSYVDRSGLDAELSRSLNSKKHIVVHGGSKQGKTWLRSRNLVDDDVIVVQCVPGSSVESIFTQALGKIGVVAVLKKVRAGDVSGTLNFEGSGELGIKLLAKMNAKVSAGTTGKISKSTEFAPIGQRPADLLWVAVALQESGKRLVIEDFHYLDEATQKEFAFTAKALGEYGLFLVIVGVWPTEHLLTYYNGDLDGRVDNIHLSWSDTELREVLAAGGTALKIEFQPSLATKLVEDSFGNVGLLQRLAERICMAEGVGERGISSSVMLLDVGPSLTSARSQVASQMNGRFQVFADNFVRGMRRMATGLEVYLVLLRAVTEANKQELIDGLDSSELLHRLNMLSGGQGIRQSDLTQALDRVDRLQSKIDIRPPVLTYSKSSRKLFLADRSFLFYREHGSPNWPWMQTIEDFSNDLAATDPLDMD